MTERDCNGKDLKEYESVGVVNEEKKAVLTIDGKQYDLDTMSYSEQEKFNYILLKKVDEMLDVIIEDNKGER